MLIIFKIYSPKNRISRYEGGGNRFQHYLCLKLCFVIYPSLSGKELGVQLDLDEKKMWLVIFLLYVVHHYLKSFLTAHQVIGMAP